jgi:hypothetical protein
MKIQEDATCIFDVNCGAGSSLMCTSQMYFLYLYCQRQNLNSHSRNNLQIVQRKTELWKKISLNVGFTEHEIKL